MALQVIGSGFGRTGTKSLKAALERLGFGPCHHMHEIIADPGQVNHWQTVAAGGKVDWSVVFAGYRAQVDWPGAHVWRDTARAFPHARIVHTTRPDDTWWASFERTIATLMQRRADLALPQHMRDMLDAWDVMVGQESLAAISPTATPRSRRTTPIRSPSGKSFRANACCCSTWPKAGRRCVIFSAWMCRTSPFPITTCAPISGRPWAAIPPDQSVSIRRRWERSPLPRTRAGTTGSSG